MKHKLSVAIAMLAFGLALTSVATAQNQSNANPFHWNGKLAAGQTLAIRGIHGDIHAEGTSSDQIEVTAEKSGPDSDEVRIEVVPGSEGVTICAVYPTGVEGEENHCTGGYHWNSHSERRNEARVDFTVKVPQNIRFDGATVNGDVEASNLGSHARVNSVNGSVSVSTMDWAEARTVNGSVDAKMGKADWTEPLDLESVNGNVDVELPASASADIRLETLNGNVQSDFPYTVEAGTHIGHPGKRIQARIGSGGRELRLKSVNGNLDIRKSH